MQRGYRAACGPESTGWGGPPFRPSCEAPRKDCEPDHTRAGSPAASLHLERRRNVHCGRLRPAVPTAAFPQAPAKDGRPDDPAERINPEFPSAVSCPALAGIRWGAVAVRRLPQPAGGNGSRSGAAPPDEEEVAARHGRRRGCRCIPASAVRWRRPSRAAAGTAPADEDIVLALPGNAGLALKT